MAKPKENPKDKPKAPEPEVSAEPEETVPMEDISDLPRQLQEAIVGFDLARKDVLGYRLLEDNAGVSIVTRGGRHVEWPRDRGRVLTPEEKDGEPRREWPRYFAHGVDGKRP